MRLTSPPRGSDGDIGVTSALGEGSTFWFTMLLEPNNDESVNRDALRAIDLNGVKALIVDGSETSLAISKEQLDAHGINTDTTSSLEEALEKCCSASDTGKGFNFIVVDSSFSGTRGAELLTKIKKDKTLENISIVVLSSSTSSETESHLKEEGYSGYITKPAHPSELPQILNIIWQAKNNNQDIPLVTRHTVEEVKSEPRKAFKLDKAQIMLAEDNRVNQMVATIMLEDMGCIVTPAGNGIEAFELVQKRSFDLIFMDCQMPEMDGFESTTSIRKYEKQNKSKPMPIVAFTANALQGDQEKCLEAGMDDYLAKPVQPLELEAILNPNIV